MQSGWGQWKHGLTNVLSLLAGDGVAADLPVLYIIQTPVCAGDHNTVRYTITFGHHGDQLK